MRGAARAAQVRLQRCGLARPFYLVEGALERWPHVAERQRMATELASIEMADKLLVHTSRSTDDTIRFLALDVTFFLLTDYHFADLSVVDAKLLFGGYLNDNLVL